MSLRAKDVATDMDLAWAATVVSKDVEEVERIADEMISAAEEYFGELPREFTSVHASAETETMWLEFPFADGKIMLEYHSDGTYSAEYVPETWWRHLLYGSDDPRDRIVWVRGKSAAREAMLELVAALRLAGIART
mgnify:CR=1 FL=1